MRRALIITSLAFASCLVLRDEPEKVDGTCTHCHGDATREGSAERRSAPPIDTLGNTTSEFPGVGAHAQHLDSTATHGPMACEACHRVPKTPTDEGHNVGKTAVIFSGFANRELTARYDDNARTCANTGCHGARSGVWTAPKAEPCGTCHGVPPPAPHPQAGACEVCHADVLSSARIFKNPALHVDGVVQVSAARCDACHGEGDAGAPPRSLDGGTLATQRGVGAHFRHLQGSTNSRPVTCDTCHVVPEKPATPTHPNGGPALVSLTVGRYDTATTTCTTRCHGVADGGGVSPLWTADAPLSCSGCHGAPPPAPHPPVANCALCHPNSTGRDGREVFNRLQHVDGVLQVAVPQTCDGCHGTPGQPAPPRDVSGNTSTSALGVGAHQAHVIGRGLARVVACTECHVVPTRVDAPGHLNGVNEVRFSGVARANGAEPTYVAATCTSAACHDISNYTTAPGGGTATRPVWTSVDGGQATCSSCHGAPPPLPHVARTDCFTCHTNATAQNTFRHPELHIDGHVDFVVP